MKPTRLAQPYRRGTRAPSPALDAMLAGRAGPSPGAGAALLAAAKRKRKGGRPRTQMVMKPR